MPPFGKKSLGIRIVAASLTAAFLFFCVVTIAVRKTYVGFSERREKVPCAAGWISMRDFNRVREGISKSTVRKLLGEPAAVYLPKQMHVTRNTEKGLQLYRYTMLETWEYIWTYDKHNNGPGTCPYAYVVVFDKEGKVRKLEPPKESLPRSFWLFRLLTQRCAASSLN